MAEKKKKQSPKQEARSLRALAARLAKKMSPLWAKELEIKAKLAALIEESKKAEDKAARLLCPFKERQVLKHVWRGQYTKVAFIHSSTAAPYFRAYGHRVKADGKTRLPGDAKLLDIDAWEPIPVKVASK